ncbi:EAL domain-containing protein [Aureimonas sp. Leaf454]|uniref:sensor domain-containing phosphodiesterase n=1 Tax=Aureimonas sp. Leaf454 TaxID=1736381 RepID=UPI00190FC829|nr:EAL domain-containing protein [Aureimonas sp. Leaf454]
MIQVPGSTLGGDLIAAAVTADIERVLKTVRQHLGMDVAFVSNVIGDRRIFRYVEGQTDRVLLRPGDAGPLDESYCQRILDGRLPELMPDTTQVPEATAMPVTSDMPIGAHMSVPLRFSDGSIYGTFCCFSHEARPSLNPRDLDVMRAFAEITAHQIELRETARREAAVKRARIEAVLAAGGPTMLFQPIIMLSDQRVVGVEALARFSAEPLRTPDKWFAEAADVGLRIELETAAIRNAIESWHGIWADLPLQLGLNCSPTTIIEGRLEDLFRDLPADRIVLELTEHDQVEDYLILNDRLRPLRDLGVKVAIDDTGSGYASMRHILTTRPNIIKLDISLTKRIDLDPMRRALAEALIGFATGFGGRVVAEGVETERELEALRAIGVQAAQGYHIARPMTVPAFRQFLARR